MFNSMVLLLNFPECDDYIGAGDRHRERESRHKWQNVNNG